MFDEITGYINTMTGEELNRVVNLVKARRVMLREIHKSQFIVGMDVRFPDNKDIMVYGTITKICRKNIKIRSTTGTNWSVYPCFVEKIPTA